MTAIAITPIFGRRELYVPRYELYLGDQAVRGALLFDVMQVTYKDDVEKIDTFDITVNNWDDEERRFKHHDSDRLNPGEKVRLHMGYLDDPGGLQLMLKGRITEMSPTFPAGGQPTLKIAGQNILHEFCREQRSDSYSGEDARASKIAQKICNRLNVQFEEPPAVSTRETAHEHIIQDNQYDIVFLVALAREEGYAIVIEEDNKSGKTKLRFDRAADSGRQAYALKYGLTLTDFQPTLSTAKQVSSVAVQGWDPVKGEPILVEVGQQHLEAKGGLAKRLKPGTPNPVRDRKEVISSTPVRDKASAEALGKAVLSRINQEVVTGTGSVVGLPELRAGTRVYLWGLGKRFSGRYFVTSTTHSIGSSGYTTQFQCRLEELEDEPHTRGSI